MRPCFVPGSSSKASKGSLRSRFAIFAIVARCSYQSSIRREQKPKLNRKFEAQQVQYNRYRFGEGMRSRPGAGIDETVTETLFFYHDLLIE